MARRVTSHTLIGRGGELDALQAALGDAVAGRARIVLLTGDPGIGKTRLIREAVGRARADGVLALVGGCVQLGEVSLPFAPLVEALREVRDQLGEDVFADVLGSGCTHLEALVAGEQGPRAGPASLFAQLLAFLTRLSARQPVLFVLEDLHWADASTRDLVAYLGQNLRRACVALVLTVRMDEVHRRHPLRPVLAALDRDDRVERIDLVGLARPDAATMVREIDPGITDSVVDQLYARTEGNPFYLEELVAAGRLGASLPTSLAELILSRVEVLSEDARRLLRAAAVIDDHVDDETLAAVTGEPIAAVTSGLREAVLRQVLILDGSGCRFRHALVREALYDDLLPGERTRLHTATATVLEAADHVPAHARWAMLAHHWDAARDAAKAFEASVRAGCAAENVYAYAGAAQQYERALGMRERVDDPDRLAGMSHADLLLRTSDALRLSARAHRAVDLAHAALDHLGDDATPERRALVLERIGRANWAINQGAAAAHAYEQAAALIADRPASRDKAFVLAALGQSLGLRAQVRQAIRVLREALTVATETGAADVEGQVRCTLGTCLVHVGVADEGFTHLNRALHLSLAADIPEDVARTYGNLADCCYTSGRYEMAADLARDGLDYVVRAGRVGISGQAICGDVIAALHRAGRWAEAERVRDDPRIPHDYVYGELRWLPMLLDTGRLDEARAAKRVALEDTADADDVQFRALALLLAAQVHAIDQQWDEARALVADALGWIDRSDEQFYVAMGYALGLSIESDRVDALSGYHDQTEIDNARAVADDLHRRMRAAAAKLAELHTPLLPESAAQFVTGEAEYARAWGRHEPELWSQAAAAWQRAGQPHPHAHARLRQADAIVRSGGDRSTAAALLRDALAVADRLGARPLQTEIRDLARRARLNLTAGQPQRAAADALDLTARERDVLRLVMQGHTNRQIGAALFISEKTASVHVTNLLRKLGVTSRAEAAAHAARTGLGDSSA